MLCVVCGVFWTGGGWVILCESGRGERRRGGVGDMGCVARTQWVEWGVGIGGRRTRRGDVR